MPTYEYECERCKRTFEVEQKISDPPLGTCFGADARTIKERLHAFGMLGTSYGGMNHPDRCRCQGSEPTPHKHYSEAPYSCARCECEAFVPATDLPCGGSLRRLIPGSTSFVLKGPGWFKDGY